jgi:hypothetical protein
VALVGLAAGVVWPNTRVADGSLTYRQT